LAFIGFDWKKDDIFDKEESILCILASIGRKLESKIFIMERNAEKERSAISKSLFFSLYINVNRPLNSDWGFIY
jgi:hypothetical protein